MRERERDMRWRCPHCGGGYMSLASADKHLTRRHLDCLSCKVERHMLRAIRLSIGQIVITGRGAFHFG
jgi:transcription elongation factor Elf1